MTALPIGVGSVDASIVAAGRARCSALVFVVGVRARGAVVVVLLSSSSRSG